MYIYYPSCSFNRIDAVSAKALVQYARSQGMEVAGCCHYDKHSPEDGIGIYFCQACRETIEKKEFQTKSFWEIINEDPDFVFPDYTGMHVSLQDCWRDRSHPEIHDAVRSLLMKMHIDYEEAAFSREHSIYCGTLHFETQKHKDTVDKVDHISHLGEHTRKMLMKENVEGYPVQPVVCTCCRCYNGILTGEGHPIHLMTLLMDGYRGREAELEAHAIELISLPDPRDQWRRH